MSFINIDLNLLRVFDAIYTQGSLTKAGETLCITQPAASHALGRLRSMYSDPLFVRTPEGMKPTPLADDIAGDVRKALQCVRVSLAKATSFRPATSDHHFRLSMGDLSEAAVMPRVIALLQREAPNVTFEVYQAPRRDLVKELIAGDADFAVDNVMPQHPQILRAHILRASYVCAVRRDHPTIHDSISIEQYLAAGHVHASSRRQGLNHVDTALSALGGQRRFVMQTQHHLDAPFIAARSDLIVTTTENVARLADLKILPLPFSVAALDLSLYWSASTDADAASVWLRKNLLSLFEPGAPGAA